jgi:hypothetical protein
VFVHGELPGEMLGPFVLVRKWLTKDVVSSGTKIGED